MDDQEPDNHIGVAIILNGVPRSGKSTLARAIQGTFDGSWINLGVDASRASTPDQLQPGIGLRPGGERPDLEPFIATAYAALFDSVAAHCRVGLNVVVDVGIHDGYSEPLGILDVMRRRLVDVPTLLVGVRCPMETIVERRAATDSEYETRGGDGGPAEAVVRWQQAVHDPGEYDIEVDTGLDEPAACAAAIGHALEQLLMHGSRRAEGLEQLERAMWATEKRGDRAWMEAHLAPGFTEHGRSGRRYTRSEILDMDVGSIDAALTDLAIRPIVSDVALVTYRSEVGGDTANRASIWRRGADGRWLLEFHQGTPT